MGLATMYIIQEETVKLSKILNGIGNASKNDPAFRKMILDLQKYMGAIFQISKLVANIPHPSKIKTIQEQELSNRIRTKYYQKLYVLMEQIPPEFRTKTNSLKIAFDRVVLSANALAKVTPTDKKKYQSVFNKSLAIFTNHAASIIIKNFERIDSHITKQLPPREAFKLKAQIKKIFSVCGKISKKANSWKFWAERVTAPPEVAISIAMVVVVWIMLSIAIGFKFSMDLSYTVQYRFQGSMIVGSFISGLFLLIGLYHIMGYAPSEIPEGKM